MRNPWRTPQRLWGLSLMLMGVGSLAALDSVAIAAPPTQADPSATSQNPGRNELIAQVIQRRVVPTVITPNVTVPNSGASTAPTQSAPPQSVASIDTYRSELLRLTNLERQRAGLRPLTLSTSLGQAAQSHSDDMARNRFFSHTGFNGSTVVSRARAAGYAYSYVGENISAGATSPEDALRRWMNSPGHRANILRPEYTEIGFGYTHAPNGQYRSYWVQVFGARR